MANIKIGKVIHFYDKISVAIVRLDQPLAKGDTVKFIKDDQEFEQMIDSMQINHQEIESAKKGDEVGIKVSQTVKENTEVFK